MKHNLRIPRLLAAAAVSCVLAVMLTGCTKEEFFADFYDFVYLDIHSIGSGSSASYDMHAADFSVQGGSTPDDGHVYDPPNPECDAKIASLMSDLYALESAARSDVSSAIQAAKDEYHALPSDQQNIINKASIAYNHLSAVESRYDSAVSSVVREMRSILQEYNQPETVADQAWSYYQSAKNSMIASLR